MVRDQGQVSSKIGAIIIGGRAFGLTNATDSFHSGIGAEHIASIKVGGGTIIPLKVAQKNDLFGNGGAYPLGGTLGAGGGDGFNLHVFEV
jgi:hypothetical protein